MKLVIVCAAVAACLAACATAPSPVEVVRIGHAAPLSGQLGDLGRDTERGALLAIEELNARGVRIGDRPVRLELVSEDDRADPGSAVGVASRLVDAKVAAVVGHLNSGVSIRASQVYSRAGIPSITPSATNPHLTRQGHRQTFRMLVDDGTLGAVLARHAVKTLGMKRVVVVDDRTAYGQIVADAFEAGARDSGATIVGREFVNDRTTDFSPLVSSIARLAPDAVFFGGMDGQAGPLLKRMQQEGLRARLFGGDGICSKNLPRLAGGELTDERAWCAESGGIEATSAGLDAFKRRFEGRFQTPVRVYAPYTYDAVHLLVASMERAASADPRQYLPVLAGTKRWQGITGEVTFDAKGDLETGPVTVFTYRQGARAMAAIAH